MAKQSVICCGFTPTQGRVELWSVKWCHFHWPWMTLTRSYCIIWRWISQKHYKIVT